MAARKRTQKQIAERYKGNLGYYEKIRFWRIARTIVGLLGLAGVIAAIVQFDRYGNEQFFSSGKISSNHAAFAQTCQKCHNESAALGGDLTVTGFRKLVNDRFRRGVDFASIDLKCEGCHSNH